MTKKKTAEEVLQITGTYEREWLSHHLYSKDRYLLKPWFLQAPSSSSLF